MQVPDGEEAGKLSTDTESHVFSQSLSTTCQPRVSQVVPYDFVNVVIYLDVKGHGRLLRRSNYHGTRSTVFPLSLHLTARFSLLPIGPHPSDLL